MHQRQVPSFLLIVSLVLNVVLIGSVTALMRKSAVSVQPVCKAENKAAPLSLTLVAVEPAVSPEPAVQSEPVLPSGPAVLQEAAVPEKAVALEEPAILQNTDASPTDPAEANPTVDKTWRDWIEHVRQAGVPDHTVAAMVKSDFDRRRQMRHDQLYKDYQDGKMDVDGLAIFNLENEIEFENELREALGEEGFLAWDRERQFFDIDIQSLGLTDVETHQAYQICKQLTQQRQSLEMAKLRKEIDQAAYDDQRELAQAEYEQQLRTLLGYDRYSSIKDGGLSAEMKRGLRELNVTPDHIDAIQIVQSEWSEQQAALQAEAKYGELDSQELERRFQSLRKSLDQKLEAILGEEAFEFYQQRQDSRYIEMTDYADRWKLSSEDIDYVYKTLKYHDATIADYRINTGTLVDNAAAVQQISKQVSQMLRDYLGPEKFELLEKNRILQFNQ